jgi:uncharacterized protein
VKLTDADKKKITNELATSLCQQPEVRKVVIFGSFLSSNDPGDVDVAVFQDSQEGYLPLAMRYRRITRPVAARIPLDIVPLRAGDAGGEFLREIERGQVIYER